MLNVINVINYLINYIRVYELYAEIKICKTNLCALYRFLFSNRVIRVFAYPRWILLMLPQFTGTLPGIEPYLNWC